MYFKKHDFVTSDSRIFMIKIKKKMLIYLFKFLIENEPNINRLPT